MAYEKRPRPAEIIAEHARRKKVSAPSGDEPPKDGIRRCTYWLLGDKATDNSKVAQYASLGYKAEPNKAGTCITFTIPEEKYQENQKAAVDLHWSRLRRSKEIAAEDREAGLTISTLEGVDAPPSPEDFLGDT